MSALETTLPAVPAAADMAIARDAAGSELKRGAVANTIAMLASNFRGVFTFLVARLLGPAALGTFSVAWANTDLVSKIAVFGLDNTITTFIARAEAVGDHVRSRSLFRAAIILTLALSCTVAALSITALRLFGDRLHYPAEMISALAFVLGALPGVALYRVSTSISRGMKVMKHDIFSRGTTEPVVTTLVFLAAFFVGFRKFAPEVAAVAGTAASGIVALCLAWSLFRKLPARSAQRHFRNDAGELLAFSAPISAYQLINAFIFRLDVIMLGWFIGRAPGVTLATIGVYGAVVDIAGGLRKVNQSFNPIFAPVVAGMTATGDHALAAATYARLAQWMLWILLPLVAVLMFAGSTILLIYGKAFQQGGAWLGLVAVACATNAFVALGETVIMVQRPRLNLFNSVTTCIVAFAANLWLIPRYGITGAAYGILIPYVVQGILRYVALRFVFKWPNPWKDIAPPIVSALIAITPALSCRILVPGIGGQVSSAVVFLALFGFGWLYHSRSAKMTR